MTQNTQTKFTAERPISGNQAGVFLETEGEREHLREKLEAERDKYLRLAAEYKNYRRRTEEEYAEASEKGKRELLIQLVSLADDLDLALAGLSESPTAVAEGLQLIYGRFRDILESNSIIAFESEGERFDPERHEAFAVVATGERETGIIQKEVRRGYLWKDRLFRPALVVVEE